MDIRRKLHSWPELGFMEFRTASLVAGRLDELGYELSLGEAAMVPQARMGVPGEETLAREFKEAAEAGTDSRWLKHFEGGTTAVVGTLEGNRPGGTMAFRFDMDALPVDESSDASHFPAKEGFASGRPGLMHACGHDGHVAVGLALASRLADRDFPGKIKLLFQPAEEGLRGASSVMLSGILDDVDRLTCFHLGLGLKTGVVHGSTSGLSASTKQRVVFTGRSSHAGMAPEQGANALLAAATAVVQLHTLPQYAGDGARLNVGIFNSGRAANIIADRAEITMETRAPDMLIECSLATAAGEVIRGAAAGLGVSVEAERVGRAPEVVCDKFAADQVVEAASGISGLSAAAGPHLDSGSEDASWLLERVRESGGDGTYVAFGSTSPAGHHSPDFDIDEASLPLAVDLFESLSRTGLV